MANPPTTNYGWTKPVVGGDGDAWGGEINADLDSIDATVKSVSNAIPLASSTAPVMDGSAAVGTGTTWARADHVHPTDTSRYAANNPSGYQTAAQVTAALPVVTTTAPLMDGAATIGASGKWADGAHVHPTDTTRAPIASPAFTGTPSMPTGTTGVTQTVGNSTTALATTAFVATSFAPLASPTFTGTPSLPTGTTGVTQVAGTNSTTLATTAFVATAISAQLVPMNDNRIINGDMRIDQRNNGASGTVSGYTVDRWGYNATQTGKFTWQRVTVNIPDFPYALRATSSSAYTLLAGDTFYFNQAIEADAVSDFNWGTASAKPVTLSFWAFSSLAGTFGGSICNYAVNRSYPFTFSLTASTWTKIVVTIPGDTGGTWVMAGNGGAVSLNFDLGSGATYRGAAGAWASATYIGATGATSVVATNGATFYVTGVKLEIGNIATPFNRQSLAKSLADCQRYYCIASVHAVATAAGASAYLGGNGVLPVTMRAVPTVAFLSQIQAPSNVGAATIDQVTVGGFRTYAQSGASGTMAFDNNYSASAEL